MPGPLDFNLDPHDEFMYRNKADSLIREHGWLKNTHLNKTELQGEKGDFV